MDGLISALLALAGIILAFHGGRTLQKAQAQNTNTQTIERLNTLVNQLVLDRTADRARIDELETWKKQAQAEIEKMTEELKRWRNYAARLIRRLLEVDPDGPIPEFDTHEKMKAVK